MSDKMYDEVPVKGKIKYTKGDWKEYAVHDEKNIKGFFGEYMFLSNFFESPVYYKDILYRSSENAYQASKIEEGFRGHLANCTPYQSKKLWKDFPSIDKSAQEWDERKYKVMAEIVFMKFCNDELKEKLLATGDKYLEETNHWNDVSWGVCNGKGENNLGKILMKIRDFWK